MASKQKVIEINGTKYTLQNPGVRWILRHVDNCTSKDGIMLKEKYIDGLLENVIVDPRVKMEDFDDNILAFNNLVTETETFLQRGQ